MHGASFIFITIAMLSICATVHGFIRIACRIRAPALHMSTFAAMDEHFMKLALRHAQHGARESEVPIGAVIVDSDGTVLAASRNRVEAEKDATAHAEVLCMREAAKLNDNWRLSNCTLYSTLEPCPMCLSAMQSFRIKRLVYGAKDIRLGACGSHVNLLDNHPFHNIEVADGLMAESSEGLLKRFFQSRRAEVKAVGKEAAGSDRGVTNMSSTLTSTATESVVA